MWKFVVADASVEGRDDKLKGLWGKVFTNPISGKLFNIYLFWDADAASQENYELVMTEAVCLEKC